MAEQSNDRLLRVLRALLSQPTGSLNLSQIRMAADYRGDTLAGKARDKLVKQFPSLVRKEDDGLCLTFPLLHGRSFGRRLLTARNKKEQMAQRVVQDFVVRAEREDAVLLLDAGTSCVLVAEELIAQEAQITQLWTNNIYAAMLLSHRGRDIVQSAIYLIPGAINITDSATTGIEAEAFFTHGKKIGFDLVILGTSGLTEGRFVTTSDAEQVDVKAAMIGLAMKQQRTASLLILADSSKFAAAAPAFRADSDRARHTWLAENAYLVTDGVPKLDKDWVHRTFCPSRDDDRLVLARRKRRRTRVES